MKKKLPKCWAIKHHLIGIGILINLLIVLQTIISSSSYYVESAIVPPPWSDPNKNPCALLPGGWQLLYWAPLKKCFKIFQLGHPCPDTMELSPIIGNPSTYKFYNSMNNNNNNGSNKKKNEIMTAECKCPPGTAQSPITNKCHKIFEQGPCEKGEYFSPLPESPGIRLNNRWGTCKTPKICPQGMISWTKDGKCYTMYTRGPCPKGKLITMGENGIAKCSCENSGEMREYYHHIDDTCHEHYTRGPCHIYGEIFLPGGKCGCSPELPHYHEFTNQCYELGTSGPCPPGHIFMIPDDMKLDDTKQHAVCQCKEGYVRWKDGICYRLYTRGPCDYDEFLINSTTCIQNFCGRGRLYFPQQKTCYRIGSQGPCTLHQVVIFDFTSRPSIDGISYKGICGCSGVIMNLDQKCPDPDNSIQENTCESTSGMVELDGNCYKLYNRGPCGPGQWLEPYKDVKDNNSNNSNNENDNNKNHKLIKAKCKCRPGYKNYDNLDNLNLMNNNSNNNNTNNNSNNLKNKSYLMANNNCYPPSVEIARYLNNHKQQLLRNYKYKQYNHNNNFNGFDSSLIVNATEEYFKIL